MSMFEGAAEVKLEDGGGRCAGRVEVKQQGQWGTVCGYNWDMDNAAVVCKQLRCGSALEAPRYGHFGPGSGPIWMADVECHGTKSALSDCTDTEDFRQYCDHSEDAGVTCSGEKPAHECCDDVGGAAGGPWCVCAINTHWELLGGSWGSLPVATLQAREKSTSLPCLILLCPEFTGFRLVNGSTACEGRVEVHVQGAWGTLCASRWDLLDAHVLCRHLNCGFAESIPKGGHFGRGSGPVWRDSFHCDGTEAHLGECPVTSLGASPCSHENDAAVICSGHEANLTLCNTSLPESALEAGIAEDVGVVCWGSRQVRLVNGPGRCAGRVEIYYQGSWGSVCDDGWDLSDAAVVCHQLGCGGALEAVGSARFGEGSAQIWLESVNCSGAEAALWDCPAGSWGQHDCGHKEDAGVICSEFMALRLENGTNCSGRLQVFYNGAWGSVCSNSMTPETVSLACKELGCGDSGSLETQWPYGRLSGTAWLDRVECGERNSSFWQCPSAPWHPQSCDDLREETHITCKGFS
ncbi:scavenger receptor cysteine-rich type 1 protein M130-like [Larus michahellis]|uniref:scavenger receptor cysteine-rich type 1 protein M130-like n=1 Tax=Larus michahellis TaxID=119627 RepID=UPI003D9B2E09